MNTSNLKKYAPQARREFISAVMKRMNELGIYSDKQIADAYVDGDVYVVDGRTFERSVKDKRQRLVTQVKEIGFINLIEQVAFSWFNRLCAIRYMELHDYLDHGFRVLSHPEQDGRFQILDFAADAAEDLELNREAILELKLASGKEEALYRQLLLAQCHQLHIAMPFLFEAIGDETELLLPDNLLRTDSVIRGLVDLIPEQEWQQVEVIGWLYQFYISEKKDEVIGKVVKSEDIPAATQLFTPNWIVQYLVQNSVGRQWLQTYPDSSIKADMPYYIEPAEQSDEVNTQLAEITPATLEPESIKVLDPACGSGHILIEAYNTLKVIYDERGYKAREIPLLILENNLFGVDIDERAAQLAGFALMMMAREDDRRIFTRGVKLNLVSVKETNNLDLLTLWRDLDLNNQQGIGYSDDLFVSDDLSCDDSNYKLLKQCKAWFTQANTLGSLIEVPSSELSSLQDLYSKLCELAEVGDNLQKTASLQLLPYVHQAWILAQRYDSVIANPPYMGSKGMNADLKSFAKAHYPNSKSDLFAMFMERAFHLLNETGFNAQVNMQSWMFLSSFEKIRQELLTNKEFITLAHLGPRAFSQISGEVVQTVAWVIRNTPINSIPTFFNLVNGQERDKEKALLAREHMYEDTRQGDFQIIPGSPIAFKLSQVERSSFVNFPTLESIALPKQGATTSDNNRFLRYWFEINYDDLKLDAVDVISASSSGAKWFPYNKGGEFRKWYGNAEHVVNYKNDGQEIKEFHEVLNKTSPGGRLKNQEHYFSPQLSWSKIGGGDFSVRYFPAGSIFSDAGSALFPNSFNELCSLAGVLNSSVSNYFLKAMSPTLNFEAEHIKKLPIFLDDNASVKKLIDIFKKDWDSYETSWDYNTSPLLPYSEVRLIKNSFESYRLNAKASVERALELETELDLFYAESYKLSKSYFNDKSGRLAKITLNSNPVFRYGSNGNDQELCERFRSDSLAELVSYSLGCMMGRYSLDREGLVYAHSSNEGFTELENEGAYRTFPADDDGIIPLTDLEWFSDDATYRFRDFIRITWGEEHLQENLAFVAESLCLHAIKPKRGESSLETIRRYLSMQFYKDHLKTYKKRPIYWLFSSGKQKAFECLVYLHRYNEGTLSRMRTEYVTPLIGKYEARLSQLEQQLDSASTSEKTKLKKEILALEKKQSELRTFDDKLKHRADMRINLDLDDGVKVNYGKFGDLLADVKSVHGKVIKS
ncbi:BREX-1 system adenine-specific DNA-methyltransferase PglX [Vibrio splendidus]|uniref:BREX-1 system adenine-specific DNA-methyltransferase PglX n=1 Tax=Vibrio splendidus TaxID=29497 RepID=UPI0006CA22E3|nr:BREX-1 system adenine-specific DNA-methyltransferase PglX [Vibrio splendidus]KPM01487.1 type II restriction endonuclease [Vibrio splendidus]